MCLPKLAVFRADVTKIQTHSCYRERGARDDVKRGAQKPEPYTEPAQDMGRKSQSQISRTEIASADVGMGFIEEPFPLAIELSPVNRPSRESGRYLRLEVARRQQPEKRCGNQRASSDQPDP